MRRQDFVDAFDDLRRLLLRLCGSGDLLCTCVEYIPEIVRMLATNIRQCIGKLFQLRVDIGGHWGVSLCAHATAVLVSLMPT